MPNFDFLSKIRSTIEGLFGQNQTKATIAPVHVTRPPPPPPQPQSQVQGAQTSAPSPQDFQKGFNAFGNNVPVATASADFAQGAQQLPPNVDPYLAAVIALMETAGGSRSAAVNNPFNISGTQDGNQGFINYPDYRTALLGGDNNGTPSRGFTGTILNNPAYADFRNSGNLADFFNTYTPPGAQNGNPTLEELLSRYMQLRQLFPGGR